MTYDWLQDGDNLVTAYARPASGPGWANTPLWVVVRGRDGRLREECVQPEDQPREVHLLYSLAAEMHRSLLYAVSTPINARKRRRA